MRSDSESAAGPAAPYHAGVGTGWRGYGARGGRGGGVGVCVCVEGGGVEGLTLNFDETVRWTFLA